MVEKEVMGSSAAIAQGSIFAAYYGYGVTLYPKPSLDRLEALVGPENLHASEEVIKAVVVELQELRPDWSVESLASAGEWVKKQMGARHPTLDQLSLETLAWLFTWSNR